MSRKPILCLDFDGVCHAYTSPWTNAETISDGPVPGLFEFITNALVHFDVHIFSTRSNTPEGRAAMRRWFFLHYDEWASGHDGPFDWIEDIRFPAEKPPATVTLDDRAMTFIGLWPAIGQLTAFRPWNK